jgi:hypothetical protein
MFILERKLSDESIFYEVAGELAISLTAENLENSERENLLALILSKFEYGYEQYTGIY